MTNQLDSLESYGQVKCSPQENYWTKAKSQGFRTASVMWDEEHDPFQVFEVEHEPCLDLEIFVRNGESITKGFYKDLIDIPDPYVILRIPGSSNSSKRTSSVDNNVNPIWNESFHFYLDPKKKLTLEITLMEANHFQDDILGKEYLDINMIVQNTPSDFVFTFPGGSKVYTTLTLRKNQKPDLRFSIALCEEEKQFMRIRRQKVLLQMKKILKNDAPRNKNEVPIIAVLGSGGGFRAMTCLGAAVKALTESGIMDCTSYISGLSGSSWFISTYYAHDNFPHVTFDQLYEEFKTSVTHNWKWNLLHSHHYFMDMLYKSRSGQPVAFTDIFGHLLGDVLLKGKKEKKLSDQRRILEQGNVAFPLYTSLHVKETVSCKAFSEWIEFSPYEIGIAKYGTFIKTEHFGSKFLLGKMIKQFPEFPLHFLQGVWGSAFTVLMKNLTFHGGSKHHQDIAEIMRNVNEERDLSDHIDSEATTGPKVCSETDDDLDVEGADDGDDCLTGEDSNPRLSSPADVFDPQDVTRKLDSQYLSIENSEISTENEYNIQNKHLETTHGKSIRKGSRKLPLLDTSRRPKSHEQVATTTPFREEGRSRTGSVVTTNLKYFSTTSGSGENLHRKGTAQDNTTNRILDGAGKTKSDYWQKHKHKRNSEKEKRSPVIQNWLKNTGILNSRAWRAGEILNPFRGLSLKNSFPLSPFTMIADEDDEGDMTDGTNIGLGCRYEPLDNTAKRLFIIDSGLAFNSPYPLLLRPQRAVDMYLSFDFSQRPSDDHMPFKDLLLAEKWARQNKVHFPPIEKQVQEYSKDPEVKELYIFEDKRDFNCPVILHFTIVNNNFRTFKKPGVPRTTKEEIDFADFKIFDDPNQPYASLNFVYTPLQYERLFKLIEFNTLLHIEDIKEQISKIVLKKRELVWQYTQQAFLKVQKVQNCVQMFKKAGSLNLKINEEHKEKIIGAFKSSSLKENPRFREKHDSDLDRDSLRENVNENESTGNEKSSGQKMATTVQLAQLKLIQDINKLKEEIGSERTLDFAQEPKPTDKIPLFFEDNSCSTTTDKHQVDMVRIDRPSTAQNLDEIPLSNKENTVNLTQAANYSLDSKGPYQSKCVENLTEFEKVISNETHNDAGQTSSSTMWQIPSVENETLQLDNKNYDDEVKQINHNLPSLIIDEDTYYDCNECPITVRTPNLNISTSSKDSYMPNSQSNVPSMPQRLSPNSFHHNSNETNTNIKMIETISALL